MSIGLVHVFIKAAGKLQRGERAGGLCAMTEMVGTVLSSSNLTVFIKTLRQRLSLEKLSSVTKNEIETAKYYLFQRTKCFQKLLSFWRFCSGRPVSGGLFYLGSIDGFFLTVE